MMVEIVVILLGSYLVFRTFQISIILGIVVMLLFLGYIYYKRFANFAMGFAMRCYTKGDKNKAFTWFERAYKHGMSLHQKVSYSYYLLREGRVEKSEQILNQILSFKIKPQDKFLAKSNHALLLLKTDRIDEAIEELEEIFPYYKNTNIYGSLGYLYILKSDREKALAFNQEAYEYNNDNAVILDNMVQIHSLIGNFEEAYRYVEEIMEKKPTFIEAYYNAAVVEKNIGKIEEAKEHLKHALTITPTFLSTISHDDVNQLLGELNG